MPILLVVGASMLTIATCTQAIAQVQPQPPLSAVPQEPAPQSPSGAVEKAQLATPSDANADANASDIVVTGYRQSLQSSLTTKRDANAVVDAITAEDVGKFPSTNVGEALATLPGVSVDNAFGEGERVSILGTDPALNRVLLNGQTIASVGWYSLDAPSRTFNYALLAPEIVYKAEVYKSSIASIDEGSVGGTVIIKTRSPFDLKANTVNGSVGFYYNDRSKKLDPNVSLLYSWRNSSKTFGITASYQRFDQHVRRDGLESYGTVLGGAFLTSGSALAPNGRPFPSVAAAVGANTTALGLNTLGTAYFSQRRLRQGGTLAVSWKPTARWSLEASGLYVRELFDNENQSLFLNLTSPSGSLTGLNVQDGVIVGGTYANAVTSTCARADRCIGTSTLNPILRRSTVKTYLADLKSTWDITDAITLSAQGGYTRAVGGVDNQVSANFTARGGYTFDLSGSPSTPANFSYTDSTLANDASRWTLASIGELEQPYTDREGYAQWDLRTVVSPHVSILMGAKYHNHRTTEDSQQRTLTFAAANAPTATMVGTIATPSDYLSGYDGLSSDMRNHLLIDPAALNAYVASANFGPFRLNPSATFNISEKITNAYTQVDFTLSRVRGNLGFRYAHTDQVSSGYNLTTTNLAQAVRYSRAYNNLLPSLNIAYDLASEVVIRGALAKTISRAGFASLSPYTSISDTRLTGRGGNPQLQPYRSDNADASLEWYFKRNSYLALSGFYRGVNNYILDVASAEQLYNFTINGVSTYAVTRPQNAGSASVRGLSVSYQQTLPANFGIQASYTYTDAEAANGAPLPFASTHQATLTPFWEKGRYSIRLSARTRSKYFTGIGNSGNKLFTDSYTSLDLSTSFGITTYAKLVFNVSNLLDARYYSYADDPRLVTSDYFNGRRITGAIQFKF